jgi:hypothetical protein
MYLHVSSGQRTVKSLSGVTDRGEYVVADGLPVAEGIDFLHDLPARRLIRVAKRPDVVVSALEICGQRYRPLAEGRGRPLAARGGICQLVNNVRRRYGLRFSRVAASNPAFATTMMVRVSLIGSSSTLS